MKGILLQKSTIVDNDTEQKYTIDTFRFNNITSVTDDGTNIVFVDGDVEWTVARSTISAFSVTV